MNSLCHGETNIQILLLALDPFVICFPFVMCTPIAHAHGSDSIAENKL